MTNTLENDKYPRSVYKFCKDNNLDEKTFYKFFGSLDGVKETIWENFYYNYKYKKSKRFFRFGIKLIIVLVVVLSGLSLYWIGTMQKAYIGRFEKCTNI